jgi:hypothetical protein
LAMTAPIVADQAELTAPGRRLVVPQCRVESAAGKEQKNQRLEPVLLPRKWPWEAHGKQDSEVCARNAGWG